MKWPNVKGKTEPTADDLKSYQYFDDKKSVEKAFGIEQTAGKYSNKHLWVRYDLPYKMNERQQRDYKVFCSGWLQYYDIIVRSKVVDHLIYFKWSSTSVSVYLSPPPLKRKVPKQPKLPAPNAGNPGSAKLRSVAAPMAVATTESDTSVDPPPVPPPPPPPRD